MLSTEDLLVFATCHMRDMVSPGHLRCVWNPGWAAQTIQAMGTVLKPNGPNQIQTKSANHWTKGKQTCHHNLIIPWFTERFWNLAGFRLPKCQAPGNQAHFVLSYSGALLVTGNHGDCEGESHASLWNLAVCISDIPRLSSTSWYYLYSSLLLYSLQHLEFLLGMGLSPCLRSLFVVAVTFSGWARFYRIIFGLRTSKLFLYAATTLAQLREGWLTKRNFRGWPEALPDAQVSAAGWVSRLWFFKIPFFTGLTSAMLQSLFFFVPGIFLNVLLFGEAALVAWNGQMVE